ncbi:MAG: zf-HC2 domain-containing protein [SAR202 cluster bacterium]|nr:zf-HC2 domain-containing protein [SAR202 cluster bacterium]
MRLFGHRHIAGQALTEYLDDCISPARRQKVETHLTACPRCRQELDSLRATVAGLRAMFQTQPRRSFILLNAPDMTPYAPRAKSRAPSWAVGLAASAAALALVAIISVDVLGGLSSGDRNTPVGTAALPEDNASSAENYRAIDGPKFAGNFAPGSSPSPSETSVPSKQKGAAPGVTEIITTGGIPDQPAPTEVASIPQAPDPIISADQVPAVIETPSLNESGGTSIYWRVLEVLLAAGAVVLGILFFQQLRRRPQIPL